MSVEQQGGAGGEAGRHGDGVAGIELDEDEAVPGGAVALGFRLELVEKGLLELEGAEDAVGGDQRTGGGGGGVGHKDVLELVGAGRQYGGTLVDGGGIEQVEDGKMLNRKDFIHAFEAKAALAVEEVGDMSLLESGLVCEMETGEFPCCDAFQENFTKVVLQDFELHWGEYSKAGSGFWGGFEVERINHRGHRGSQGNEKSTGVWPEMNKFRARSFFWIFFEELRARKCTAERLPACCRGGSWGRRRGDVKSEKFSTEKQCSDDLDRKFPQTLGWRQFKGESVSGTRP